LREFRGRLREADNHDRRLYEVECKCGYKGVRRADHVDAGKSKYCRGCSSANTLRTHPNPVFAKRPHHGVGDLTRTFWYTIKTGADVRGISFNITIEYAWELLLKQSLRCALSGVPINLSDMLKKCNPDYSKFTASLDRIDSSKGYDVGNVQWVHKEINYIKRDLPEEDFISWCRLVAQTQGRELTN
jgi:hypothetical protein